MSAPDQIESGDAEASIDASALIASLRAAGAHRFDPVRLHYLEVLAARAGTHQGKVRQMLDEKLMRALTVFQERFEQERRDASEAIACCVPHHPQVTDALQRLHAGGDFKEVHRLIADLRAGEQSASLGALVRQLEQRGQEHAGVQGEGNAQARPELKTLKDFRSTWSKLSIDKQLAQALEQAPANAGPINSHMLVLRSLALMRDIAPDYLNRFMSYADTLLSLDPGEKEPPGKTTKRPVAKRAKK